MNNTWVFLIFKQNFSVFFINFYFILFLHRTRTTDPPCPDIRVDEKSDSVLRRTRVQTPGLTRCSGAENFLYIYISIYIYIYTVKILIDPMFFNHYELDSIIVPDLNLSVQEKHSWFGLVFVSLVWNGL